VTTKLLEYIRERGHCDRFARRHLPLADLGYYRNRLACGEKSSASFARGPKERPLCANARSSTQECKEQHPSKGLGDDLANDARRNLDNNDDDGCQTGTS